MQTSSAMIKDCIGHHVGLQGPTWKITWKADVRGQRRWYAMEETDGSEE